MPLPSRLHISFVIGEFVARSFSFCQSSWVRSLLVQDDQQVKVTHQLEVNFTVMFTISPINVWPITVSAGESLYIVMPPF